MSVCECVFVCIVCVLCVSMCVCVGLCGCLRVSAGVGGVWVLRGFIFWKLERLSALAML